MKLREKFEKWMTEYADEYEDVNNTNNYRRYPLVKDEIPAELRPYIEDIDDNDNYKISGSYGKGRWTSVPWVAVFDKRITKSARSGVYIVYLLNKDEKDLYISLIKAASETLQGKNDHTFTGMTGSSSKKNLAKLKEEAEEIRGIIQCDLPYGSDIKTGSDNYDAGSIYYKKYSLDSLPNDDKLESDLKHFLDAYHVYYERVYQKKEDTELTEPENVSSTLENAETEMSIEENIQHVKNYISAAGFNYSEGTVENLYLSLKSKPFVILAGISGTGKTRIVKLFAEAIGAEYKMIPVRPDWSDSSDLIGYINLNGKFVRGAIFDFIYEAQNNPEKLFILCLDEMNLARVEYYFSDFLSVIETRELKDGRIISEPIVDENKYGSDEDSKRKYGRIDYPENLFIVGTVNMDETTFPFSKKVLDRANTIEFSDVDLMPQFADKQNSILPLKLRSDFLRSRYLTLTQCGDEAEYVEEICSELQEINNILKSANLHVGYRVRDEIVFYMLGNKEADDLIFEDEAMDNEIAQKILPRIQGNAYAVKEVLCELFKICAADYNNETGNSDSERMQKTLSNSEEKYKYQRSAEKIMMMTRRYEENGFTSYWL